MGLGFLADGQRAPEIWILSADRCFRSFAGGSGIDFFCRGGLGRRREAAEFGDSPPVEIDLRRTGESELGAGAAGASPEIAEPAGCCRL